MSSQSMEEEKRKVDLYLGEEETPPADDSLSESESEPENGDSETAPLQESQEEHAGSLSTDGEDGCFTFIKNIKVILGRKKKPDLSRATSSKSSLSGSALGSVLGSVSGSDATLDSLRESASEPLPSNIPGYYATDEYFFGYPKRGYAVIINNEKFEHLSGLDDRGGSSEDEKNLGKIFKKLGFRVKRYHNLRGQQIADKLGIMADRDHTDKDCFACAILTHGAQQVLRNGRGVEVNYDLVFGVDGVAVSLRYLMDIFSDENCESLVHKPRLFFIQACRGEKYDLGKSVDVYKVFTEEKSSHPGGGDVKDAGDPDTFEEEDADEEGHVPVDVSVPLYRDFLVAYGTPPGYYAWRRDEGSWFITSLHRSVKSAVLEKESLMEMLTRCAWDQAMNFSSKVTDPKTGKVIKNQSGMKAVSHITHMLTKNVYFRPKLRTSQ